MNAPFVWIVILHWKELELTRQCLRSLAALRYQRYEVLVVDNDSNDGSLEHLRAEFPHVHTLALAANTGFAGGCNAGIRVALAHGADYVLLFNNDARATPDVLTLLVAAAQARPQLGILTAKVVYSDQPDRLYGHGGRRLPFRVRLTGMEALDRGPWDGPPVQLDFVFGCAMLIKRRVVERVGLFDERFFMYFEDVDYCYRATDAGFAVGYLPGAVLPHIGAGSTRRSSGLREFLLGRSRQLFFAKHVRGAWWLVYVPYETFYTLRFVLRLLRQKQGRAALLYLGGTLAGLLVPITQARSATRHTYATDAIIC